MITTVVSVDGSDYLRWQAELLAYSHQRAHQSGALVVLTDTVHVPGDDYPPYNKPYAIAEWLESRPVSDEIILVLDPDIVFVRSTDGARLRAPSAHDSMYRPDDELSAALAPFTPDPRQLQSLAVPLLVRQADLRRLAPLWFELTKCLRADRTVRELVPWTCEMWACSIAAQKLGLIFQLGTIASVPPFSSSTDLPFIHYSWEFDGFDKRLYRPWGPLPDGGSEALRFLRQLINERRKTYEP